MKMTPEELSSDLRFCSLVLRRLEQRLQSEPAPDSEVLHEFRQAVDNARLAAWSAGELINAQRAKKDPNVVLVFLVAERLRRFDQMVRSLCEDIERHAITIHSSGMESLIRSVQALHQRLTLGFTDREPQNFKVRDGAR